MESPNVIPLVESLLAIETTPATPSPPAQELCMNEIAAATLDVQDNSSCMTSSPPTIETFHVIDSNEIEPIDGSGDEVPPPPAPAEENIPVEAPMAAGNPEEDDDYSCTSTGSRSPTPVHFEITPKGVKVISDKESFL